MKYHPKTRSQEKRTQSYGIKHYIKNKIPTGRFSDDPLIFLSQNCTILVNKELRNASSRWCDFYQCLHKDSAVTITK